MATLTLFMVAKGAGKSALYSLLISRSGELFDKSILLVVPFQIRWVGRSRVCLPAGTIQQRLEALWDLTLDYLAWTEPDGGEPRLQRSVCVLERRGR